LLDPVALEQNIMAAGACGGPGFHLMEDKKQKWKLEGPRDKMPPRAGIQ
jgi:hypothetical protein